MRFLVVKWWGCLARMQHQDCLGPAFSAGAGPHTLTFIHAWALSGHAAMELERKAAAVATGPAGAHALKKLGQMFFQLFLWVGAIFSAAAQASRDFMAIIMSTPRTARICMWTVRSGLAYKRIMAAHADHDSDEFIEQLVAAHTYWATQLAVVCRKNGGIYVKFGQFAVAFGAVPREYRMILAQLEDKARPRPYHVIRRVLQAELSASSTTPLVGEPGSGAIFMEFEEQATAAASLAQVHRARLATGEEVAVKLQYPGLRSMVRADLGIMKMLANLAGSVFPEFSLGWLCDELEAKLRIELDFRNEIHNANTLRSFLAGSKAAASVPRIHEELSTPHMIIMEWIQGIKLTDVTELKRQSINPRAVGMALVKLFAELTFIHGYVHGDPHPGNLMVLPKGSPSFWSRLCHGTSQKFVIVLLDHGTYLTIPPQLREQFCQLWCSFAAMDKRVQAEVSTAIAGERAGKVLPVLLTHQTKTRREETALQRSVGINCFSDMTAILSSAPRDLVELLRINTVIRASSSLLGISMAERKRIFAWFARRGLPSRSSRKPHVHPSCQSVLYRARLLLLLSTWTGYCWSRAMVCRTWCAVLGVFGDVLFGN